MSLPDAQPHSELRELVPDVYWLQGTTRMGPGMSFNRVMTVLRHEGELTLINAIRPTDPSILDELGTVKNIVKIGTHGMDDPWFVEHYDATRWAAEGIDADKVLGPDSEQPVPWMQTFQFEHTNQPELALLVDRDGGLLITCDSVQNWPAYGHCSLIGRVATYMMGFNARPAQIGPPWRKMMTPEGGSLEPDFRRLCALPFRHLVGGHGAPLRDTAKEDLKATVAATF